MYLAYRAGVAKCILCIDVCMYDSYVYRPYV